MGRKISERGVLPWCEQASLFRVIGLHRVICLSIGFKKSRPILLVHMAKGKERAGGQQKPKFECDVIFTDFK